MRVVSRKSLVVSRLAEEYNSYKEPFMIETWSRSSIFSSTSQNNLLLIF